MSGFPQRVCDVVMVDDEEITVELVTRMLRDTNLHLKSFTNEVKALTFLHNHAARVLIVDQRMPRVDGLELLQQLAGANGIPASEVYLASAAELPEEITRQVRQLGAQTLSKEIFRNRDRLVSLLSGY